MEAPAIGSEHRAEQAEARRKREQRPHQRPKSGAPDTQRPASSAVLTRMPAAILPSVWPPAVNATKYPPFCTIRNASIGAFGRIESSSTLTRQICNVKAHDEHVDDDLDDDDVGRGREKARNETARPAGLACPASPRPARGGATRRRPDGVARVRARRRRRLGFESEIERLRPRLLAQPRRFGVARRTASGERGGDALVMSGVSSTGVSNSGKSGDVDAGSGSTIPFEEAEIVQHEAFFSSSLVQRELRKLCAFRERELVAAVAAPIDLLETEISALGAFHG